MYWLIIHMHNCNIVSVGRTYRLPALSVAPSVGRPIDFISAPPSPPEPRNVEPVYVCVYTVSYTHRTALWRQVASPSFAVVHIVKKIVPTPPLWRSLILISTTDKMKIVSPSLRRYLHWNVYKKYLHFNDFVWKKKPPFPCSADRWASTYLWFLTSTNNTPYRIMKSQPLRGCQRRRF